MKCPKESLRFPKDSFKSKINQYINSSQTLEEYFIIIGPEPKISSNKDLYALPISELNDKYSKQIFKPKILSKFPPLNKSYINIDDTIIDICFPNGYNLLEFTKNPKPIYQHFILDNSFYSIDYPLKYVSCLKIYENLHNYFLLDEEIKKGNNKKNENNDNNNKDNPIVFNENYKNYYFPKILCMISTQNFFKKQEDILNQIYQYYLDDNKTNKKVPIEKKILTTLFNIPLPPRGTMEIEFNLEEKYKKIKFKRQKMNQLPIIKEEINLIFTKFDIKNILEIFKHVLFETKILIFGKKINEISNFIYGFISLIFPFKYLFQISSSIPSNAYNILESISPYIFGINKIFKKSFFKENKIDIYDLNILIVDLEKCSIKYIGNKELPDIPKCLYKPLFDGLHNISNIKANIWNEEEIESNYKKIRSLFYDFFVNMMYDYDFYIKNDYFKNKHTNSGIKNLYKIEEFINSHCYSERDFYKIFSETQMFCDFIYRKMIPKDNNEKLATLFFDESLRKKLNKKLFSKNKPCIFLSSKEYDYNKIYEVPQTKILTKEEKNIFTENNINKLLSLGQKVTIETDNKTHDKEYLFHYYLFPVLNNSFFEYLSLEEYFLISPESLSSEIDRVNSDILSKSLMNMVNNNLNNNNNPEMKNYIYLVYLELWAYNYWYLESYEKEEKFAELLEILSKISFHDAELFDFLFESLNNFKDKSKILQLYDFLLKSQISPSSFIYQTVNSYFSKSLKKSASVANFKNNLIDYSNNNKSRKKCFRSFKDGKCFGDKIKFYNKQKCPECGDEIDISEICLNFKNMRKDFFWAKCPKCGKYIIPKLGVLLGTEILNKERGEDVYKEYYSSCYTRFILHSPYEIKINLKNIKKKEGFKKFHIEYFKEEYPSLFWSCIWYFKLYKINLDIILPYEYTISQELFNHERIVFANILSKVHRNNKNNVNINVFNYKYKCKKCKLNKKKLKNDNLIIHSVISTSILSPYEKDKEKHNSIYYNDSFRKSTIASSNKSTLYSNDVYLRTSFDSSIISESNTYSNDNNKFKSCTNISSTVRLNTLTSSFLLSPSLKSRQLFDFRSTNKIISFKQYEKSLFFPFNFPCPSEEEENEYIFKKNEKNKVDEFTFDEKEDKSVIKRKKTFEKSKKYKIIDYENNNNGRRNSFILNNSSFFI